MPRINTKIHDHLLQLAAIRFYAPKLSLQSEFEHHIFTKNSLKHVLQMLHSFIEIQAVFLEDLFPRERQKLLCERSCTFSGLPNLDQLLSIAKG